MQMSEKIKTERNHHFTAWLPLVFRAAALAGMGLTVLLIAIGFYWGSFQSEFRMKGRPTNLSEDVVGEVNGYQKRESQNGVLKYYLKADRAVTFSDNHQELETVALQLFDDGRESVYSRISADKAIFVPAADGSRNFKVYFAGNVDIVTKESLNIKTDQLTYNEATGTAEAEELIRFNRENVSGSSTGGVVNIGRETLDLLKDVEILTSGEGGDMLSNSGIEHVKINSGSAFVDKKSEKITLDNGVAISITPVNDPNGNIRQPTDITSNRATAHFEDQRIRQFDLNGNVRVYQKPIPRAAGWTKTSSGRAIATIGNELERVELFQNVEIESTTDGSNPTNIRSNNAVYFKPADTFELDERVVISTNDGGVKTNLSASRAVYERTKGLILMYGGAAIGRGNDFVRGNRIRANLNAKRKLKSAIVTGNAFLRQITAERRTEVSADELNARFNQNEGFEKAKAVGQSHVVVIPTRDSQYAKYAMKAPLGINLDFRLDGTLNTLETKGRTTIRLDAPNDSIDSADKTLTADQIKTYFFENGNDISRAEAVGDAELIASPRRKSVKNFKTTVNGARFDCDFYRGNNARSCRSSGKSKVVRDATVRGILPQTLQADRLNSIFDQTSHDLRLMEAHGNAKFNQGVQNGISDHIAYDVGSAVVRFRGGEPTVWDSKARSKAKEIDWDTRAKKSSFREKVSTTYYGRKSTGSSTPFTKTESPVFVTSNVAFFDHDEETALFTGDARTWQGNNYVRAERLYLQQRKGELFADGNVQSLLYDVNQTVDGRSTRTPVYVSAREMHYREESRKIHYENEVDIRQGANRMKADAADIFLDAENELTRSVLHKSVVITQPNRRATGNYAEYSASNETALIRGNPARVIDAESGSSEGREIMVYLKENRVVGSGKTIKNAAGRNRTVYKIKKSN